MGPMYYVTYDELSQMRDMFKLVEEKFKDPVYVASYCLIMVLVGLHLYHGVQSIFSITWHQSSKV